MEYVYAAMLLHSAEKEIEPRIERENDEANQAEESKQVTDDCVQCAADDRDELNQNEMKDHSSL